MTDMAWATGMRSGARRGARGFSMVELLVTMVLAGIIFAAMVPLFVNAMKRTSGDRERITATSIAQDRIEKIRLLAANGHYSDISSASAYLPSPTFNNGQFGPSATVGGTVYTITYAVTSATNYKGVDVSVQWPTSGNPASAHTIVMDPTPVVHSTGSGTPVPTPSPSSTTGYYTLTVGVTGDDCTSAGVTVTRTDVTPNVLQVPNVQIPTGANGLQVAWTGLVGGPNVVYHVVVNFKLNGTTRQHDAYVTLTDDTPIYFDTLN
jgi:prepilin-type N-terminal cleavage/methylation domain-containing protein